MAIFILPTAGARGYRGKYPTRPRSLSHSLIMGTHVELNDGTRLWSADPIRPDAPSKPGRMTQTYSNALAAAVEMTDSQYSELLRAAEISRSVINYGGHGKRASIEQQARAVVVSIRATGEQSAQRNAKAARRTWSFAPGCPYVVVIRTSVSSVCFGFATLAKAREYLADQLAQAEFIRAGAAPAGPRCLDPLESFILLEQEDRGIETLADHPWRYMAGAPGADWTKATGQPIKLTGFVADPAESDSRAGYSDNGPVNEAEESAIAALYADDENPATGESDELPSSSKGVRRDNVEYNQGKAAREAGEPEGSNPYHDYGTLDSRFRRWNLGWEEASAPSIDSVPIVGTWASNLPLLLVLYTDGNATGRAYALGELKRLAAGADAIVAQQAAESDDLPPPPPTTAQARNEGATACARDVSSDACPYSDPDLEAAWHDGYRAEMASWRANRQAEIADDYGDAAND